MQRVIRSNFIFVIYIICLFFVVIVNLINGMCLVDLIYFLVLIICSLKIFSLLKKGDDI